MADYQSPGRVSTVNRCASSPICLSICLFSSAVEQSVHTRLVACSNQAIGTRIIIKERCVPLFCGGVKVMGGCGSESRSDREYLTHDVLQKTDHQVGIFSISCNEK